MVFIRNLVGGLLAELDDNIDHDRFKRLLYYSRRLASFQSRAKLVGISLDSGSLPDCELGRRSFGRGPLSRRVANVLSRASFLS